MRTTPLGRTVRFAVCLIATLLLGCAAPQLDVAPPQPCGPQREFHVVGHGWHTGLIVPGRDLEQRLPGLSLGASTLVELGWGDAAYYRAVEPAMSLALRALLYPTDAVLHVVMIADDVRAAFPSSTLFTLTVPESGYERLLDHVVETFARTRDGELIALEPGLYGESRFYRALGRFHMLNTCNTWVARAVAATGYPLRSANVVTADGLLSQLRQPSNALCHVAD